jgi:DNA-binding transcriptional MerR regulator
MATKEAPDTAGLVSIGQLAKAAGVSSRTIRYYEELGILPEPRRSPGGTRRYPLEYRDYIDTAVALKNLGFRLDEIKPLARLAIGRSVSSAQRESAARLVDERIEALARQASMLRQLRDSVRGPDAATAVPVLLSSVDLAAAAALHGDGAA